VTWIFRQGPRNKRLRKVITRQEINQPIRSAGWGSIREKDNRQQAPDNVREGLFSKGNRSDGKVKIDYNSAFQELEAQGKGGGRSRF